MSAHIPMRPALTVAVAALLLAGCEKTPRDRLQGRWLGESIENLPPGELPKASGWVKGMAMEFNGSRVTITIPAESPRTGSFKVVRKDPETLLVSFLRDEGGRDEAEMALLGDRQLKWRLGEGREIVLVKAQN